MDKRIVAHLRSSRELVARRLNDLRRSKNKNGKKRVKGCLKPAILQVRNKERRVVTGNKLGGREGRRRGVVWGRGEITLGRSGDREYTARDEWVWGGGHTCRHVNVSKG